MGMTFFEKWGQNLENSSYIYSFLSNKENVRQCWIHGTNQQEKLVCDVLTHVNIARFINCICIYHPRKGFSKRDIPQFSRLDMAGIRLPELLAFSEEGLGFDDLGYQLIKSKGAVAQKKYGENHSKLAELMGLVTIERKSCSIVKLTSLGEYLISCSIPQKEAIWRRMLLRNPYLQYLLGRACKGRISYAESVACLAPSTQGRRRSNVHLLVEFILKGSAKEFMLENIDWKCGK